MNAYRTIDSVGSEMIVMGTSADHARAVGTQILADCAAEYPDMISGTRRIATVSSL